MFRTNIKLITTQIFMWHINKPRIQLLSNYVNTSLRVQDIDKVGQILIQRFNLQKNISIRPNKNKKQNKNKTKQKKNKYVSSSLCALHFGYQIFAKLSFQMMQVFKYQLKWKGKHKYLKKQAQKRYFLICNSNIWCYFWFILEIDTKKERAPIPMAQSMVLFLCVFLLVVLIKRLHIAVIISIKW